MKTMATISTMILAAALAVAQSAPAKTTPKKPAAPASQSSTGKAATPATSTSTTAAKSTTATKAPKTTTAMAKPAAAKPAAKPEGQSNEEIGKGKRDPFISPVVTRIVGPGGPACTSGPHCLVIDQVTLQGTVKTEKGWIAVLANPAKKVYYLRQNDAMFDGYILRIDGNSVVFKQDVLDAMGRKTQREVVKNVAPTA